MRHGAIPLSPNARLRTLATGLRLSQVGVMHHGLDLVCDHVENLPAAWPDPDPLGKTDGESLEEPLLAVLSALKAEVLAERRPRTIEREFVRGTQRWLIEITVSPDLDGDEILCGLITTLTDITEARERERALTALLREVSHRSRNLLSIAQSIATQTRAHAEDMDHFLAKFRGRLQALAGTQDLVTDTDWRGARLHDILRGQLGRLGRHQADTVSLVGDNPMLGPNAALHLGLALHELLVNAVLHGALSHQPAGEIVITCRIDAQTGGLVFEWRETGTDVAIAAPRFGTAVLERIVPTAVAGTARYTLGPHSVAYRLAIPREKFES